MESPFIIGTRIYLRPLKQDDLNEKCYEWFNDPEVNRYLASGIFPSSKKDLERFYERVTNSSDQVILAFVDRETDAHIGNIRLRSINWVHRKAILGLRIGDKQFWGRGIGTEAIHLIVGYGFFRLNLNKIELGVYAEHEASVRCCEKAGFQVEGRFRQGAFHEGQYKDRLRMGLLRSEYKPPYSGV